MTELSELPLLDYYLENAHHGSFPEPSHNPAADSVTQSSGVCNLKLYSPHVYPLTAGIKHFLCSWAL